MNSGFLPQNAPPAKLALSATTPLLLPSIVRPRLRSKPSLMAKDKSKGFRAKTRFGSLTPIKSTRCPVSLSSRNQTSMESGLRGFWAWLPWTTPLLYLTFSSLTASLIGAPSLSPSTELQSRPLSHLVSPIWVWLLPTLSMEHSHWLGMTYSGSSISTPAK